MALAQFYFPAVQIDKEFKSRFKCNLVVTMEQLIKILKENEDKLIVGFDTETTGLSFFKDYIVGFSFSFDDMSGYYVPLRHKTGINASIDLLYYFYEHCLKKKNVLMYNVIFDCFMLAGERLDVLCLKIFDVLCLTYCLDSDSPSKNLKTSALRYLGREVPTFDEVLDRFYKLKIQQLKDNEIINLTNEINNLENQLLNLQPSEGIKSTKELKAEIKKVKTEVTLKKKELKTIEKLIIKYETGKINDITFPDLDPEMCYDYACYDSADTYGLFKKLYSLLAKECPVTIELVSGEKLRIFELDNKVVKSMLYYQTQPIYIDNIRMQEIVKELVDEMKAIETEIFEFFGYPFNLKSSDELSKALASKNIDTKMYSDKTGKMLTNADALEGVKHPIGKKIIQRNSLFTQITNYASKFVSLTQGYISYNVLRANTGRILSSNSDKNEYFMNLNFQNLTKPDSAKFRAFHQTHYFYKELNNLPDILGYKFLIVKDNEYIDAKDDEGNLIYQKDDDGNIILDKETNQPKVKKIIGPLIVNGIEIENSNYIVEGPSPVKNIRSAVTRPSDDWYFVSIDYSSEEIAIAAVLSGEPAYLEPYIAGEDIHANTAIKIWGVLTPKYRKIAKNINFALQYGGTAYTLNTRAGLDMEMAEDVIKKFWKGLPVLYHFQQRTIRETKTNPRFPDRPGTSYTYFGRPRRILDIFSDNFKRLKHAENIALNVPIQGTAADIIRIDLVNLYQEIFSKSEYNNKIRWVGTVHDEIDLLIHKDNFYEMIPKLKELIEIKFPERKLTLRAEFEIGTNFGNTYVFEPDENGMYHPKKA